MGITKEILEKLLVKASTAAEAIEQVMDSDEFREAQRYADNIVPMRGPKNHATAVCRICGCTQDHACPGGCWWVDEDLCSTCMEKISDLVMLFRGAQRALEDQMNLIDQTINPDQYDVGGPYAVDDLECLDPDDDEDIEFMDHDEVLDESDPYQEERCCMCPNSHDPLNPVCPGIPGSLHPDPTLCADTIEKNKKALRQAKEVSK